MKRFILVAFTLVISVVISGCQQENGNFEASKPKVPKEADEFGQMFAQQLNYVAKQLKKNHVDYSNPDELLASIEKYAVEIANQKFPDNPTTIGELHSELSRIYSTVQATLDELTPSQLDYLYSVSNAQATSRTTRNFFSQLNDINKTISSMPVIEQRRPYYASAALYHMYHEATMLLNEGYIPFKSNSPKNIRTRSVNDEFEEFTMDADITECSLDEDEETRSLFYGIPSTRAGITVSVWASWIISVSGITITAAISALVPVVLFMVVVYCVGEATWNPAKDNDDKRDDCLEEYYKCVNGGPDGNSHSGGPGKTKCWNYYEECIRP